MPLHGQVQQGLHRVRPRLLELCEERGHLAVGRLLYLVQLAPGWGLGGRGYGLGVRVTGRNYVRGYGLGVVTTGRTGART